MTVLFGPPDAIAASRCLIARSIADGKTADHPRRCAWCDEPIADLRSLVGGFNDWAAYRPTGKTGGTSERHEVRIWMELDREEQRRQIVVAQALEAEQPPEPPPAVVAPEPPPVVPPPPVEKDVAWLG